MCHVRMDVVKRSKVNKLMECANVWVKIAVKSMTYSNIVSLIIID